jgi:hypothetical protein
VPFPWGTQGEEADDHSRQSSHRHNSQKVTERTSNNIDKLVRDGGLATTVVLHLQTGDHVTSVLRGIVHGIATGKV